jgi:hypothetical protein
MATFADYLAARMAPTSGALPLQAPQPPVGGLQLADILGGLATAQRQAQPAPAVAALMDRPQMAMAPAAGAAAPTQAGPDPMAALMQALSGGQPTPQATPRDPLAAIGAATATGTPNPSGQPLGEALGGIGDWITNLFSGGPSPSASANAAAAATMGTLQGGQPSPLQLPAEQGAAPTQIPQAAATLPAAAQQTETPAVTTGKQAPLPKAAPEGKTAPAISPISAPAYNAITAAKDIPEEDKGSLAKVFENGDLYKTMITIGAALSRGEDYGSAMEKGAATFLGAQQARVAQATAAEEKAYKRSQDTFKNNIEAGKLKRGMDKDAVDAELTRAQVEAAKAKIPLTQQQALLVQQQISESKTKQAKMGKEMSGLLPKDYAKMKLDVINDMSLNGEEPAEGMNIDDAAQLRVNLALPDAMRQYAPIPTNVRKEVEGIAAQPTLTPEDKTRLERYRLLYGPVF